MFAAHTWWMDDRSRGLGRQAFPAIATDRFGHGLDHDPVSPQHEPATSMASAATQMPASDISRRSGRSSIKRGRPSAPAGAIRVATHAGIAPSTACRTTGMDIKGMDP
jgi:hypothetical protein